MLKCLPTCVTCFTIPFRIFILSVHPLRTFVNYKNIFLIKEDELYSMEAIHFKNWDTRFKYATTNS
jgi:hypothetical protein